MSLDDFDHQFDLMIKAIKFNIKSNAIIPSLVLIYTQIDNISWLNRPGDSDRVKSEHFIDWVNSYVLTNCSLECSAEDLYSARCAILHTGTVDSDMIAKGQARPINYAIGKADIEKIHKMIESKKDYNGVAVKVDDLFWGLLKGAGKWLEDLREDTHKMKFVLNRIDRYYMTTYTY